MKTSKYKLLQHVDEISVQLLKEGMAKGEPRSIIAGHSLHNSREAVYVIRQDAKDIINKIKFEPDLSILKNMATNSFQILIEGEFDSLFAVDYLKEEKRFIFTFVTVEPNGMMYFANLNVDTQTWTYTKENPKDAGGKDINMYVKKFEESIIPTLIYLFMADIVVEEIAPGKRTGPRHDCYVNDSDKKVRVVTNKWNTTTTRSKGFDVAGHFALRACGTGRKARKLVFIAPYQKDGYTRRATSQAR